MVLVSYRLNNNSSLLQTKFRAREGHEARRVGLATMPLDEHSAGGPGERQARRNSGPAPLPDLLEMAPARQQRAHRRDEPPVLPRAAWTELPGAGSARGGMDTGGAPAQPRLFHLAPPPLPRVIRDLGGGPGPPHAPAPRLAEQTECAPHQPAVVRPALAAALLRAPPRADGLEELEALGVEDAEHGRRGPAGRGPAVRRRAEPPEPGALGEGGQHRPRGACQPALAGPGAPTLEGMPQPHGADRPGPEGGRGGWGEGAQRLSALRAQGGDPLYGQQTALLAGAGCHASQRGRVV
jgi:hypothetical protein